MVDLFEHWLETAWSLGPSEARGLAYATYAVSVLTVSWVAAIVARRFFVHAVAALVSRTETDWDDLLQQHGVFASVSLLAPALIFNLAAAGFGPAGPWIQRLALAYMIAVGLRIADGVLSAGAQLYQRTPVARDKPIRGYVQVVKIALYVVTTILILSVLLDRDPWGLLTGLGAMSAVLLLVFRDSLLGFVASVQLVAEDLVRRGDWIEMPKYGADGDVIDVSLHTVKVQNWDKTITTIPTQALIGDSFKNWRGMQESGGRRIKRALFIDVATIRFCDEEMLERFAQVDLLRDYIERKRGEIAAIRTESQARPTSGPASGVNGRSLTNVGTFRAYIEAYLRQHPDVRKDMTFLVRQLAPTDRGLPIEIYVFSREQRWAYFEALQSDIFDHLLAIAPYFELAIYQQPSGRDFRGLGARSQEPTAEA